MSLGEFDIIRRYFSDLTPARRDVPVGIGDDAAVVRPQAGRDLAVATDTLVHGVHFPDTTAADAIGHKALAVNLSDLAAMGAEPAWATLALTLPAADPAWLQAFAGGFGRLAREAGIALIGGDLTRGPMAVSVTVVGYSDPGTALRRAGLLPGERLYVSGELGAAAAALAHRDGHPCPDAALADGLRAALDYPAPRLALGRRLRGLASAAIDVSDGLLADAGHLAEASGCGIELWVERLPRGLVAGLVGTGRAEWIDWPLTGGDDYELLFSVPEARAGEVEALAGDLGLPLTWIGRATAGEAVVCRYDDGRLHTAGDRTGYRHFTAAPPA